MIKILFLGAGPIDMDRLDMEKEAKTVVDGLQRGTYGGQFVPIYEKVAYLSKLQGLLHKHRPHIVHFSGHGTTDSELILLDDHGYSAPVPQAALTALFSTPAIRENLRCAVLSACDSVEQARAIAASIECVIGMKEAIADRSASAFAGSFYEALSSGQSVQAAFDRGVTQLQLLNLPGAGVPILHARPGTKPEDVSFLPPLLFCHIHRANKELFQGLEVHLQSMEDRGVLRYWSINRLRDGELVGPLTEQNLLDARHVLLGVSPRAVIDAGWNEYTERVLDRHRSGGVKVIPLMLGPVSNEDKPWRDFQPFLDGAVVTSIDSPPYDIAWFRVSEALRGIMRRDQG